MLKTMINEYLKSNISAKELDDLEKMMTYIMVKCQEENYQFYKVVITFSYNIPEKIHCVLAENKEEAENEAFSQLDARVADAVKSYETEVIGPSNLLDN